MASPGAWFFGLRAESGADLVEVDIYDSIGEDWFGGGLTAKALRAQLREHADAKEIRVRINSAGGDVTDGIAIYNLLAQSKAKVSVVVDGLAASMASVIAMAGDRIELAAGAFLMVHNPWGVAMGEAEDLRAHADVLDKMRASLAAIYAGRTKRSLDDVLGLMDAETWFTAEEAVAAGFADAVQPQRGASAAYARAVASLDPARFRNLPIALRAAVEQRAAASNNHAPPPKDSPMALPKLLIAALSLPELADEAAAVNAAQALAERAAHGAAAAGLLARLEEATGATGEAALGAALAWRASHEALPAVREELVSVRAESQRVELAELIRSGRDSKKLTKAEADKLEAQVQAGEISLAAAKSFVAVMAPKEHLSGAGAPAAVPPPAIDLDGEGFAKLAPSARAALKRERPEVYAHARKDALSRGLI